ncbi:MAG: ferritin-like domain-containing protein [Candidatus Bathyarchaeota archaeon]|nr:ferritin-like domain-containing protein [Candidatus Bathyarchaeota archaeon]
MAKTNIITRTTWIRGKFMSFTEKELVAFFHEQEKLEEEIVKSVSKALETIKNPVVEAVLKGMSYDSSKHAEIYRSAAQIIAVAPALTEEEFKHLEEVVRWHIENEEKLIGRLREAINKTANDRVKFLLESILADEKRHHDLLNLIMNIIVKGETITDQDWWDIIWKNVPFHGAPGG